MNYYIAVFSSRTSSFAFCDILLKHKISCKIVNTPNKAQLGCGVCVKFAPEHFALVKQISGVSREFSMVNFYKVVTSMGSLVVTKI